MKNTKNTRVQKQQKKAKKQRRMSSTLMCGLVLSGVALPAVAVLADNAVQSQTSAQLKTSAATFTTQVGTMTEDLISVDGYVYGAGTPVIKSVNGNWYVSIVYGEMPTGPTENQTIAKVPAQYVGGVSNFKQTFSDSFIYGQENLISMEDIKGPAGNTDPDEIVNKIALRSSIETAQDRLNIADQYTVDSIATLKTVLGQSQTVFNSSQATQAQVDDATSNLNAVISGLVAKPAEVDKSALQAIVDQSTDAYNNPQKYTVDSWTPFKSAYEGAVSVLNNTGAIDVQVDDLKLLLNQTFTALEAVTSATPDEEGTVTFKYVDAGSHQLKEPKTVTGKVGDEFSEKAPTIEGYTLDTSKSDETATGHFTKTGQTYYFVYNKDNNPDPVHRTSKITVKLVDKDTGKEIKASKTIEGEVGTQKFAMSDPYFSTAPDGYVLTDNVMNTVFQFEDKDTTVELKYTKNDTPDPIKQGSVTVSYVDESGKSIQDSKTIKGDVGSKFSEKAPASKGYTLTSDSTLTGEYTEQAQSIKFTYKKDTTPTPDPVKQGTINFKLVDESGKELKALFVSQNEVGTSIKVSDSDYFHINGYQIKSGAKEYTYTDQVQTVTITYSKIDNNNGGNTNNNGGNTNNADNGNKTSTNGDSTSGNSNSSSKSEVTPLATDTAKENKATLPTTGEANTLWLFLSGLGVLLTTGLALVFKRKHN